MASPWSWCSAPRSRARPVTCPPSRGRWRRAGSSAAGGAGGRRAPWWRPSRRSSCCWSRRCRRATASPWPWR
ncbi:hypothetical protein DMB42_13340 [Nonomuraea sp. WAC 01424]|nr:hypothetical protein DMB42_13340 [Nonomuraea sp. WAC 01424]